MRHGYCTTREERRNHVALLGANFRQWKYLTTAQLRKLAQVVIPNIKDDDEDRDSFIQVLVMDHVEKMI